MEYLEHEEGVSQYEDLEGQTIVPARYIDPVLQSDRGNVCIEALPPPCSQDEIIEAFTKGIPGFSLSSVKNMTMEQKLDQVDMLFFIRFPLLFAEDLVRDFRSVMLTSYRSRTMEYDAEGGTFRYVAGNAEQESDIRLMGHEEDGTNTGLALTGISGSGKTTAVGIMLSHYPQVIVHTRPGCRFVQIVWIMVNCSANSSLTGLYISIGAAIDRALGNKDGYYQKEVTRQARLDRMEKKVEEYVAKFAISMIILDEIQEVDFTRTKANSFDSIMTLMNCSKTGLMVIGTEEARAKMFNNPYTARRIGREIKTEPYCRDRGHFQLLVEFLLHYQWCDKPIEATEEIVDVFFELSGGVVSHLINFYRYMCIDYIVKDEMPDITPKYIRGVADKYLTGLQDVLAMVPSDEADLELARIWENAEAMVDDAKKKAFGKRVAEKAEEMADKQLLLDNTFMVIRPIFPEYTDSDIQAAFDKVMKRKAAEGKSGTEIARMVIDELQKKPKRKVTKPKQTKPSPSQMINFLNMSGKEDET